MKFLILVFGILFSSFVFAKSNTTMVPVSTQKVANASLTCPARKWCDVVINLSVSQSLVTTGAQAESAAANAMSFNIKLKSGDVISGSTSTSNAAVCSGVASSQVSVGGVVIGRITADVVGTNACSTQGSASYNFYSMEYYN